MMDADLYQALGVNRGAPIEVIRRAYRKAAKQAHPDAGGAPEAWEVVTLAHDVLTDPKRRKKYDETGSADDIEAAAMQSVYDAISMVVATIVGAGHRVETYDVLSDAVKVLRAQIQNISSAERQSIKGGNALDATLSLFKPKKGKKNMLKRILGAQFQGQARAQQSFAMQRKICERAIAILQDHEFSYTAPAAWW